jgi:hypothetical protein
MCACCTKFRNACSLGKIDLVEQKNLQTWLDSQPLPNTLDPLASPYTTLHQAATFLSDSPSEEQRNMSIVTSFGSPILVETSSTPIAATSGTLSEVLNRPTTPPLLSTREPIPASRSPDTDGSQSTAAKRPRDTGSTRYTEKPDKAAKTARTHDNTPLLPPSPPPDVDATKEIGRLEEIIRDMQVEQARLHKHFNGYRMMSGSIAAKAAEQEIEAEREAAKHKVEMYTMKRQLDIVSVQSAESLDQTEEIDQVEMGGVRRSDQAKEDGWESRMRKLESQYNAAVTNADTSRKERNEARATLATIQIENVHLNEQLVNMTANHEYEAIELSDSRAKVERLETEVTELAKVKTELKTALVDKDKLSIELEDAKDVIEELKSKRRIADDMLQEA